MKGYGQFCPVAKAAEIFAERWTPILLRDLLRGPRRFSGLRLTQAIEAGLVEVDGPRPLVRAFPRWIGVSGFAHYGQAAGG